MAYENNIFRRLQADLDRGDQIGRKLTYDKVSKTLREPSTFDDPDRTIQVTPEDMKVFTKKGSISK
jgi:hypothetical protein